MFNKKTTIRKASWAIKLLCLTLLLPTAIPAEGQTILKIGPPLKGAWLNSLMPGQGYLIEIVTDPPVIFVGWFTFPRASDAPQNDPVSHRWYTIQGNYSGSSVEALIYETAGGSFLGPTQIQTVRIGVATIRFTGCNTAELDYRFDDTGESGTIIIVRAIPIDETACDSLLENPPVPDQIASSQTSVFMNVGLLDMPSGEIRSNQMVVVENGVITHVGNHNPVLIPADAAIIDGSSRYLVPGMVDTHTHLATNVREFLGAVVPSSAEEAARSQLILYLARGVTTILNNGDFGEALPRWGTETESGELVGPNIYAAQYARGNNNTSDGGPPDRAVTNASQAREFTRQAFADGYQFMKVYNQTPRDAALAILDEARILGMPVLGHFPQTMSSRQLLDNGLAMVAHSGAYLWKFFRNNINTSDALIAEAIQMTLDNGTAVTATLGIEELIDQIWCNDPQGVAAYWAREETRYMHPTTVSLNNRSITSNRWNPGGCNRGAYVGVTNFLRKFTLALHEAGATLTMGTDSPTVLGVPGFSAIDEVQALVNSGIPLVDAIRMATWNGGRFISSKLELAVPFGAIRDGWRADLVLLDSNPLESTENLEDIVGVMANGNWKSTAWFNTQLEIIAEQYGN